MANTPLADKQLQGQVTERLKAGISERKIASELGISRQYVSKLRLQAQIRADEAESTNPFELNENFRPTIKRAQAVSELVSLSTRPEGVRNSEMQPVLRALFGLQLNNKNGAMELAMTQNQLQYLKDSTRKAANDAGQSALFIPEWIPRSNPLAANDLLVQLAGELHDIAQDKLAYFMSVFPEVSSRLLFKELVALSFKEASPEPVETRCTRNSNAAAELHQRLRIKDRQRPANDPLAFPEDSELDKLCA
jgi:site-specific recombinase XerC